MRNVDTVPPQINHIPCSKCNHLNRNGARECANCGEEFEEGLQFNLMINTGMAVSVTELILMKKQ